MTDLDAVTAILTRWLTLWPAASFAAVPAVGSEGAASIFENDKAKEPVPPARWAYVAITHGTQQRLTMGPNARFLTPVTVWVRLHVPAAGSGGAPDGVAEILKLAKAVKDVLSVCQFGQGPGEDGVILREASLSEQAQDGLWWIMAVVVQGEYTEYR